MLAALRQPPPESGHRDTEQDDEDRIDGLEPACRNFPPKDHPVSGAIGKEGQRTAGLLESDPEEDDEEGHDENRRYPMLLFAGQHPPLQEGFLLLPHQIHLTEPFLGGDEDDERGNHPQTSGDEPPVPAVVLAKGTADQRGEDGAEVDAHVKDGHAAVLASAVLIFVQFADHRRDVRLEKAVAEDHETERHVEERNLRDGHGQIAESREDGPDDDALPFADVAIGHETAQNRRQVDQAREPAVDRPGMFRDDLLLAHVHEQELRHVQHEDGPHAVVAESFPCFRGKKPRQPFRVSLENLGQLHCESLLAPNLIRAFALPRTIVLYYFHTQADHRLV